MLRALVFQHFVNRRTTKIEFVAFQNMSITQQHMENGIIIWFPQFSPSKHVPSESQVKGSDLEEDAEGQLVI